MQYSFSKPVKNLAVLAYGFILVSFLAFSQPVPIESMRLSNVNSSEYAKLLNSPKLLESSVLPAKGETEWIDNRVDIHGIFDVGFPSVRKSLRSYGEYEKIFSRVNKSEIEEGKNGSWFQTQHIRISAFGFNYDSMFKIGIQELEGEGSFDSWWYLINSDGSFKDSVGYWHIERMTLNGKEATYIRYINRTVVKRQFFLQDQIMALAAAGDFVGQLVGLAEYAKKHP